MSLEQIRQFNEHASTCWKCRESGEPCDEGIKLLTVSDLEKLREVFGKSGHVITHDPRQRKIDVPASRSTAYFVIDPDRYITRRTYLVWDLDENNNVLSFMVCH